MATRKKGRKVLIFTVISVALIALTVAAIVKKKEPIITVQTEKVARRNLTELVVANGKIQPVMQVTISPEVAGEITELPIKEGDHVKKGDLLVQIKPDNYLAVRNSAEASYKSAIASQSLAQAQLDKAEQEYKRNQELFKNHLVSDSVFLEFKTDYEVAKLQYENALHQTDQAKFGLDKAADDLSKTTVLAPIDGTITQLKSRLGERVLGTSYNMGTEIMTVAQLDEMEALVDIGEMDVVLMQTGQLAHLEVDAFKDRKFTGIVSEIADAAKGLSQASASSSSQDATKFEVHIRVQEKERFLPGMTVSAEIETRSRTNVLSVPIAAVTTRMPPTNSLAGTNTIATATNSPATNQIASAKSDKKSKDAPKTIEVVFAVDADRAKMVPVKIGISDENYYEIIDGLKEGQEVVSGNFRAIRDLQDGKKILKGTPGGDEKKAL